MRPVLSHRRFQALKNAEDKIASLRILVNGSNQLGAERLESSNHGVRLVWCKLQNLAFIRV